MSRGSEKYYLISIIQVPRKARVIPLKPVTVPRLELSAGVLAAKMDQNLKAELDLPVTDSIFWIDATSVLQYITCEPRRFKTLWLTD